MTHYFPDSAISSSTYGSKLAVATGGGSKYPKHVDNVALPDQRKLTVILYLNPEWDEANGGEIRLWGHDGASGEMMEVTTITTTTLHVATILSFALALPPHPHPFSS